MKRTLLLSTTFAVLSLLLGACSDDPASATGNGSVSAKVNGGAWSATNVQGTYTSNVLGIGGSQISGADNKQINITGMISQPGTYPINPFGGLNATYTEGSSSGGVTVTIFQATGGTVKVDEISATGAKGTFSFEARDTQSGATRSVTEGTFDLRF